MKGRIMLSVDWCFLNGKKMNACNMYLWGFETGTGAKILVEVVAGNPLDFPRKK